VFSVTKRQVYLHKKKNKTFARAWACRVYPFARAVRAFDTCHLSRDLLVERDTPFIARLVAMFKLHQGMEIGQVLIATGN
jgi:hypothetical protein